MNPEIFIRTYAGDAEWLSWCLKSCALNASQLPVTVVCPKNDIKIIDPVCAEYDIVAHTCEPEHKDGYVDQQWTKLHADLYCPDADFIIHIDSDCLWADPDWQNKLFKDDKPVMIKTPFRDLETGSGFHWQKITEQALGIMPEYEFMRRQPLIYPFHVYKEVRDFLNGTHAEDGGLAPWFRGIKNRAFSEYNVLGAWCHHFINAEFHWIDTSEDPLPEIVVEQSWSWGGLTPEIKAKWEALLS